MGQIGMTNYRRRFIICQLVNILAITNLINALMVQKILGPVSTQFALIFYGILLAGSLFMISFYSVKFVGQLDNGVKKCSSDLSPVFKYLIINPAISAILVLITLGFIFDLEIMKVSLLVFLVTIYPLIIFIRSVFVVFGGDEIRVYDYSNNCTVLRGNQIKKIKKAQLGLIYKLTYSNSDGRDKSFFFFPRGSFLIFNEPDSIKELRSWTKIVRG
jgi:hypothetical protein